MYKIRVLSIDVLQDQLSAVRHQIRYCVLQTICKIDTLSNTYKADMPRMLALVTI